ncbi:hypothetical protein L0222_06035 [bacterium]|nr:hypothetical protein [bacterium]
MNMNVNSLKLMCLLFTMLLPPALAQPGKYEKVAIEGFGDPKNVTLGPFVKFQGFLYVAGLNTHSGCQVWRSQDGNRWEIVVGPGAKTASGFGNSKNTSINELLVFRGWLYAGIWNEEQGAELRKTKDGELWQAVVGDGAAVANGFGQLENSGITALNSFKGLLIAATGSLYCNKDAPGTEIWISEDEGKSWEPVAGGRFHPQLSLGRDAKYILDLEVFQNRIYAATGDQRQEGSEIWRSADGVSWEPVVGADAKHEVSMGNTGHDMIYDLSVYAGHLYAAVLSHVNQGGALWRSSDGNNWEIIVGDQNSRHPSGFNNKENYGFISLTDFGGRLFLSTANKQGTQLWASENGAQWELILTPEKSESSDDSANTWILNLTVFQGNLYAGTSNSKEGVEIWRIRSLP